MDVPASFKRRREQPSVSDAVATWQSLDDVGLDFDPTSLAVIPRHIELELGFDLALGGESDLSEASPPLDDDFFTSLSQPFHLGGSPSSSSDTSRKRLFDEADLELGSWVADLFPDLLPAVPLPFADPVNLGVANPLLDHDEFFVIHPMLRHPTSSALVQPKKEVNALIKFRFAANSQTRSPAKDAGVFANQIWKQVERPVQNDPPPPPPPPALDSSPLSLSEAVAMSYLPPSFGDVSLSNSVDKMLHTFFIAAICTGRTVIKTDNAYEAAIAPMADTSDLVKHSLLSLAATYVMDFRQYPQLTERSNYHHQAAISLVGQEIQRTEVYCPKKEDALVAALYILAHNENVNWESRRRETNPKWYRCGTLAEEVLGRSNPAFLYANPKNVQCTYARTQLASLFALSNVFSDCLFPLDTSAKKCSWSWLMQGTEREQRKISGMNGLCPKLIHVFAKTSFLAAKLYKNPSARFSYLVARDLERLLSNFWQWSDLSEGHATAEEMMERLSIDDKGKVDTPANVTEIIAEAYVAAAQIYLQCRVFRQPRKHPVVQKLLARLLRCIEVEPTSGHLYTSQSPLFSTFIAGIVAWKPEQRKIIETWFGPICAESRGNVPPAWRVLQFIWKWLDDAPKEIDPLESEIQDESAENVAGLRSWWEDLVDAVYEREGRLNLT